MGWCQILWLTEIPFDVAQMGLLHQRLSYNCFHFANMNSWQRRPVCCWWGCPKERRGILEQSNLFISEQVKILSIKTKIYFFNILFLLFMHITPINSFLLTSFYYYFPIDFCLFTLILHSTNIEFFIALLVNSSVSVLCAH